MSDVIVSILTLSIVGATPIVVTGVGGIFGEKAGITNIGLEGNMLIGAFAAAMGSYYFNNAWMGLVCGAVVGMLVGLLHAYLCVSVKINHVVSGLAINIFATSITVYILGVVFGSKGNSPIVPSLSAVDIPLLSNLPYIGFLFTNLSPITIMAPFIVLFAYLLFNKFSFGNHVISVGENPTAASVLGIDVKKTQYLSVIIGGLCCGLAGAFLSISNINMFVRGMSSGRGYIAIATILFGRYHPVGVALAGLFFGAVSALQISLQGSVDIPSEFIQMVPYVLTILAVVLVSLRTKNTSV